MLSTERIDELWDSSEHWREFARKVEKAVIDEAQRQEPVGYADLSRVNDRDAPRLTSKHFTESQSPVYSAPTHAQQSPAVGISKMETASISPAVTVPDASMVNLLRTVWKHGFDSESHDDIDFCNHITIAQSDDSPRITEQDAREFAISFLRAFNKTNGPSANDFFTYWVSHDEGRALLNKLNKVQP